MAYLRSGSAKPPAELVGFPQGHAPSELGETPRATLAKRESESSLIARLDAVSRFIDYSPEGFRNYSGRVRHPVNLQSVQLNLCLAWLGILLGFVSGLLLGLFFHDDRWLGGYASFKRRLYRLGHISFFGLALVNFVFYLTARDFSHPSMATAVASWGFAAGAVSMPLCCLLVAHQPRLRGLFAIPVLNLIAAASLTLWEVIQL